MLIHTPGLIGQKAADAGFATGMARIVHYFLCLVFWVGVFSNGADALTFTVTTTADEGDGSLRGAIDLANANAGPDTIHFNVPGSGPHIISPQSSLPALTDPVIVDGYTQPGATPATASLPATILVEIRGNYQINGLLCAASATAIKGLAITGFVNGIRLSGEGNHEVAGNHIGIDPLGVTARGNIKGMLIESERNTIGGIQPAERNVISGNDDYGILINTGEWTPEPGTGNLIQGNYIGPDASAEGGAGNLLCGIVIESGADNKIGGETQSCNIIAYNGIAGVFVRHGVRNAVLGNEIFSNGGLGIDLKWDYWGTEPDGPTPNDEGDIDWGANDLQNYPVLFSVTSESGAMTVQGTLNSLPNTVYRIEFFRNSTADMSGYGEGEHFIGSAEAVTDADGDVSFSVDFPIELTHGEFVSCTATGPLNSTSEFSRCIIFHGDVVVANTNDEGPGSLRSAIVSANLNPGVDTISFAIPGIGPHTIRPASPLPRMTDPVIIDGYTQPGAELATDGSPAVLWIEIDGSEAGVSAYGILATAGGSQIKGLTINRFAAFAIGLDMLGGNTVTGNHIGTDCAGAEALPNSIGIWVGVGGDNTIGGATPESRNIVSGNDDAGIVIYGSSNAIRGNFIGVDASGVAGIGNDVGVVLGFNNLLGGEQSTHGNVISGNNDDAVQIVGADNIIQGNVIGKDAFGAACLGNGGAGVFVGASMPAHVSECVEATFSRRQLLEHSLPGRSLRSPPDQTGNLVIGNAIIGNGELGIDLYPRGLNANDDGDNDTGPNNRQNFPLLVSVTAEVDSTRIGGILESQPNQTYHIEFFSGLLPDPSSYGEGAQFIGEAEVTTDTNGYVSFVATVPGVLPPFSFVSCTATDGENNTSEFSRSGSFLGSGAVTNTDNDGPGSFRFAIYHANGTVGLDSITFNIPGSGPHTISPTSSLPSISDPVVIDGYTQPGALEGSDGSPATIRIHLDGTITSDECNGLYLTGGASTIRGLAIGGFPESGIMISGAGDNVIEGNYIGTDTTGTVRIGNGLEGVLISNSGGNTVGGATAAARNVISGNDENGVKIDGENSFGNVISGNYIGLDVLGSTQLGNVRHGLFVSAPDNTIGGTMEGMGNVISGNGSEGIYLFGSAATGNVLYGNRIGTDATGSEPLGNDGWGIWIRSPSNTVGGSIAESRNIISANGSGGAYIAPIGAAENVLHGNLIGTDVSGELALGNEGPGIRIQSPNNAVGGMDVAEGNTIAFNGENGIEIDARTGNALLGNLIFSNAGLGIDLERDGVTENDEGDTDSGANGLQNFPELLLASADSLNAIRIQGTLSSVPNETFTLQFFHSTQADSTGYGEGETFLGQISVVADGDGHVSFDTSLLNDPITAGSVLAATATDPASNTSEFSRSIEIQGLAGESPPLPVQWVLPRSYPNPFRQNTTLAFGLQSSGRVTVKMYNVAGELTRTLANEDLEARFHTIAWDGRSEAGSELPSGTYFYEITSDEFRRVGTVIRIR